MPMTRRARRGAVRERRTRPSEARKVDEGILAEADPHRSELRAAVQRRNRLVRVEDAMRIERLTHALERGDLEVGELHAHALQLLRADAVLAADRSAFGDHDLE